MRIIILEIDIGSLEETYPEWIPDSEVQFQDEASFTWTSLQTNASLRSFRDSGTRPKSRHNRWPSCRDSGSVRSRRWHRWTRVQHRSLYPNENDQVLDQLHERRTSSTPPWSKGLWAKGCAKLATASEELAVKEPFVAAVPKSSPFQQAIRRSFHASWNYLVRRWWGSSLRPSYPRTNRIHRSRWRPWRNDHSFSSKSVCCLRSCCVNNARGFLSSTRFVFPFNSP